MEGPSVNSHVYIPKTILKNFSFPDKNGSKARFTSYIKLPYGKVHYGNIKNLNTQNGAYTSENEKILDTEYESYLGNLVANINKEIEKGKITKRLFDVAKVKKFFAYQAIRDDACMRNIALLSGTRKLDDNQIFNMKNTLIRDESNINIVSRLFDKDALIVMINMEGYLFGSNYIVNMSDGDKHGSVGISLTPKIFLMLTEDYDARSELKATKFAWRNLDEADVLRINHTIFQIGHNRGSGIIISKDAGRLKKFFKLYDKK